VTEGDAMNLNLPVLKTNRLLLRRLNESDALQLFQIRGNEFLNRHIDVQIEKTVEQTVKYIEKINTGISDSKWLLWGVEEMKTHQLIGTVSLWQFEDNFTVCELGYVTHPDFQGLGYTKEALQAVLTYGFNQMKLLQVSAYTEKGNSESNFLLLSLGFEYVKTMEEEGFYKKRTFHMNMYKKNH